MSTPRDLVLWLLEQGYETKYFKLSVADQTEWHETAVLEADRLKTMVDNNLYQEYLSRLDEFGVKIKLNSQEYKLSLHMQSESQDNEQPQQTSIDTLQNDLKLVLKRAIDLRNEGEYEESLQVLNSATKSEFKSELIDDNCARALVHLGRIPEALSIWEKLIDSDVQRLQESSRQFVEKFLQELQDKLSNFCEQNSWEVVFLKNQCNNFQDLESLVCKEVIEMNNACHPEISMLLIQHACRLGFNSSALNEKQAYDLSLKCAINLRNKGEYEESLKVLNLVIESGYKSDLIDDNCARALVHLGRIPEALSIWEKLVDSDVQRLQESSRQFVEKFLQELQDELSDFCEQNSWEVVFLKNQCNNFREFEMLVCKEVIEMNNARHPEISMLLIQRACHLGFDSSALNDKQSCDLALKCAIDLRNKGEYEESLKVLNLVIESGYKSDLIDDNCARALVKLDRIPEALSIWEKLVESDVQRVQESSRQFVEKFLQELQDELNNFCDQNSWEVVFLKNQCNNFREFEMLVCKEVIEMNDARHPEISMLLIQRACHLGFDSSALNDKQSCDLALKCAIDLRNKGEYEESLKVLNLVIESGYKSDLIDDNCARALVKLGRIPEALSIWEKLVDSDVQRVQESSRQFVEKFLQELQGKLSDLCDQNSWETVFLKKQFNNFQEFELLVLKEVIELRDAGKPEISLLLIKKANQLGFHSSVLIDNKARALVSLNLLREAISVWSELVDSPNEKVANNAKKMIGKYDKVSANFIKNKVNHVAAELNIDLINLNELENITLSELEICLLKDVVALRESRNNEATLRIVDCAISAGAKRDEHFLDNRARALNNLNRFPEAISVWNELQASSNEVVRKKSKQFADNATKKYLQSIQTALIALCNNYGISIQNLSSQCVDLNDFEKLILQEAISARQSGQAEFSYQLIKMSCELGLTSPRLKDNQARALINLERIPEAVSIWRELLISAEDSGLEEQIEKMLDKYGLISDRTCIVEKCLEIAVSGDIDKAKKIAINAIIDDPDWQESMNLLMDVLKIGIGEKAGQSSQNSDLVSHQLDLQLYESIISNIEERLQESVGV